MTEEAQDYSPPTITVKERVTIILPDISIKFDGTNGYQWRQHVELSLEARFLLENLSKDPIFPGNPSFRTWKSKESLTCHWLLGITVPDMADNFLYVDIVKIMWDEITKNCAKQQNDWRCYDLMVQAAQAKQGDSSVMAFSCRLKAIWRQIDYYWSVDNPNSSEHIYTLKQRMFTFLMGLNPEYENVQNQILHRETMPDLDQTIGMVMDEEKRLKINPEASKGNSTDFSTKKDPTSQGDHIRGRTGVGQQGINTGQSHGARGDPKDDMFCVYCKKRRHTKENCWKLAQKNQQ
ncbi:uncharacterized protein LOC144715310 [Wolffia australiana]